MNAIVKSALAVGLALLPPVLTEGLAEVRSSSAASTIELGSPDSCEAKVTAADILGLRTVNTERFLRQLRANVQGESSALKERTLQLLNAWLRQHHPVPRRARSAAVEVVLAALRSGDVNVVQMACVLAELLPELKPGLKPLFTDSRPEIHFPTALALHRLGSPLELRIVSRKLAESDPSIPRGYILLLSGIRDASVLRDISSLLNHQDKWRRLDAAVVLMRSRRLGDVSLRRVAEGDSDFLQRLRSEALLGISRLEDSALPLPAQTYLPPEFRVEINRGEVKLKTALSASTTVVSIDHIDVSGATAAEIYALATGSSDNSLHLSLRDQSGDIREVSLTRPRIPRVAIR